MNGSLYSMITGITHIFALGGPVRLADVVDGTISAAQDPVDSAIGLTGVAA